MFGALVISVRLHNGRYNGAGDWPPSPARLFQALVAGAGLSGPLPEEASGALAWLEKRVDKVETTPLVGAPVMCPGQRVMFYMPNNDLDVVGGDPHRLAEIRTATKFFRPALFDASVPFLYAWPLDAAEGHEPFSRVICALAERLYQLGRGVDMAWAWGDLLAGSALEQILLAYPGRIYRPSGGGNGVTLLCPHRGSLESLQARHLAYGSRFRIEGNGNAAKLVFVQPPEPSFRPIQYESPPERYLYDLRSQSVATALAIWPLWRASELVVQIRDGAVDRLHRTLPARRAEIERVLVGRKPDGTNAGPASARVRIIPLPSLGHHHADHAIRRVLVEVPAGCPLRADDVNWAFSGLELVDRESGEVLDVTLTPAADESMLDHYGVCSHVSSRVWRSVTPVALPETATRRRIEPTRMRQEAKGGRERAAEQTRAAAAVMQALRHAEIDQHAELIRVQREPFEANGERVESFATGTRFDKHRLWHVEITFAAPLAGPVVIGDGRFLGLGVMTPVRSEGSEAPRSPAPPQPS